VLEFVTHFLARRRRATDERGVTAIMVALTVVGLLVASAMVLDFGLVRIDRQVAKSVADSATLAGVGSLDRDDKPHPYLGVCAALRYLRANDARFTGVTSSAGWTDGTGAAVADGCSDSTLQAKVCSTSNPTTWAKFTWTGNWQGAPIKVVVQSPYELPGPSASPSPGPSPDTGWPEDTLPAAQADSTDGVHGCDQLATVITQSRKPGLGSLATGSDLTTSVRSVGRVAIGPGGPAPAMLLLDRTGCNVLTTSGSGAYVHVYGGESAGQRRPGTIHADSDASTCSSSNPSVFNGGSADSIVAYAAPSATSSTMPDPGLPGLITSVAAQNAALASTTTIANNPANVYGSAALNESDTTVGKTPPAGAPLVTRRVVDDRYLGLDDPTRGVKGAIAKASNVFSMITSSATAQANGYTVFDNTTVSDPCNLTASNMSAVNASSKVYINCTSNNGYVGTAPIPAATVMFAGAVNPLNTTSLSVSLPNASHVYVVGAPTKDALSVGNGGSFSMNTAGNLSGGQCSSAKGPSKAVLFVKAGDIKETGGLLQLCKTTVFMMGNRGDACLPSTAGTAPNPAPCGGTPGDGQIAVTGGAVDWTAPNTMDVTTDGEGWPTAAAKAAWTDPDGPEDLALWDESASGPASTGNPKMSMAGNGALHTVGVFMVPNAAPFTVGGGGTQTLTNAQYIASDIAVNGGAYISMKVDANSAVTMQALKPIGLVR
jgi:hypothetical protein